MKELCLIIIKKHFSVCIEQKREIERDIESKRKRGEERTKERDPHNLEEKAFTDHPIGEGSGLL